MALCHAQPQRHGSEHRRRCCSCRHGAKGSRLQRQGTMPGSSKLIHHNANTCQQCTWYSSTPQRRQAGRPAQSENWPAEHSAGPALLPAQEEPAGHSAHARSPLARYRPGGHSAGHSAGDVGTQAIAEPVQGGATSVRTPPSWPCRAGRGEGTSLCISSAWEYCEVFRRRAAVVATLSGAQHSFSGAALVQRIAGTDSS